MIFEYRGIKHEQNEVALISVTQREMKGQTNQRLYKSIDWIIRGVKIASTQQGLTDKLAVLEAQYGTNFGDAKLYLNDGVTVTIHVLSNADTINGVRVVGGVNYLAGWPGVWGVRTEYVYRRSYQVHLRCEVLANEYQIASWHQTVRQIGLGGPDFEVQETLLTQPVVQTTNLYTSFDAEQFGTAIGVTGYPAFPAPMWPGSLKPRMSSADMVTPQYFGAVQNLLYPIAWRYRFRAATSLFAVPPLIF